MILTAPYTYFTKQSTHFTENITGIQEHRPGGRVAERQSFWYETPWLSPRSSGRRRRSNRRRRATGDTTGRLPTRDIAGQCPAGSRHLPARLHRAATQPDRFPAGWHWNRQYRSPASTTLGLCAPRKRSRVFSAIRQRRRSTGGYLTREAAGRTPIWDVHWRFPMTSSLLRERISPYCCDRLDSRQTTYLPCVRGASYAAAGRRLCRCGPAGASDNTDLSGHSSR